MATGVPAADVGFLRQLVQHLVGQNAVNSECPGHPELGTPLHAAMSHGRESAVEVVMAAGADPRIISSKYDTTLNAACASGNIRLVEKSPAPVLCLSSGSLVVVLS